MLISGSPTNPGGWRTHGKRFALYRSEDGGGTWMKITAGLPAECPDEIDTFCIIFSTAHAAHAIAGAATVSCTKVPMPVPPEQRSLKIHRIYIQQRQDNLEIESPTKSISPGYLSLISAIHSISTSASRGFCFTAMVVRAGL